jgi:hypothetical protein
MSDTPEHPKADDQSTEPQDAGSQALAEAFQSSFRVVQVVMVLMVLAFFC